MCLIIDTNLASVVFSVPARVDFIPVIDYLTSSRTNGKLVVGGKLATELDQVNAARRFVKALQQAGRVRFIPMEATEEEAQRVIASCVCVSDDAHIIALARVSGARILCSEDTDLHRDFTHPELINDPRGHIYQTAAHIHLLRRYGHTDACRKRSRAN